MTHRCCYCINAVVAVVVALKMVWVVLIIMQPKFLLKNNTNIFKYTNNRLLDINHMQIAKLYCLKYKPKYYNCVILVMPLAVFVQSHRTLQAHTY